MHYFLSPSFRFFLSVDDTGSLLLPGQTPPQAGFVSVYNDALALYNEGWAWRARSASDERAKPGSSSPKSRRLTVRLHATARTRATICGWTSERGGFASIRTLKYA